RSRTGSISTSGSIAARPTPRKTWCGRASFRAAHAAFGQSRRQTVRFGSRGRWRWSPGGASLRLGERLGKRAARAGRRGGGVLPFGLLEPEQHGVRLPVMHARDGFDRALLLHAASGQSELAQRGFAALGCDLVGARDRLDHRNRVLHARKVL